MMEEIRKLQEIIEEAIRVQSAEWENATPANLYKPVVYALRAGGKRLRPLMVVLGYRLFGDKPETVLPAALAVEIFHNFTLLHDDIMDKAEIRRNQPAVHVKFNENSAILSGDVMAFLAYQFLLRCPTERQPEIISLFSATAIEVCEGQQMDMDFETRFDVTPGEYLTMIRLKTAVLLGCALKTGALAGGALSRDASLLYEAGMNLGMAFQLQDDLLDSFGDETAFGKKIGGDIVTNKKTFLLVEALHASDHTYRSELMNWLVSVNFNREEKISAVRNILLQLKVKEKTETAIRDYHSRAMAIIRDLDVPADRRMLLTSQFSSILNREK